MTNLSKRTLCGITSGLLVLSISCGQAHDTSQLSAEPETGPDQWLGLGFDELSGLPSDYCFMDDWRKLTNIKRRTESTSSIAATWSQLNHLVTKSTSFGLSVSWNLMRGPGGADLPFPIDLSASFSHMSEFTQAHSLKKDDTLALAEINVTNEIGIFAPADPTLGFEPTARLEFSPYAFRRKCGDQFIKTVTTGSRLLVTVQASLLGKTESEKKKTQTSLEIKIGDILQAGGELSSNTEFDFELNNLLFSTKCLAIGKAPASVCSELNIDDRTDMSTVIKRFNAAIKAFGQAVDHNPQAEHAILDFETHGYSLPWHKPQLDREGPIFYDNRPRKNLLSKLGRLYDQLRQSCNNRPECTDKVESLKEDIKRCSIQSFWDPSSADAECGDLNYERFERKYL